MSDITYSEVMAGVKLRVCWFDLRARCTNPKNAKYANYGGRGITVCDRWNESFEAFFDDMGLPPEGHTLDRINNDGNYELSNCRWATPTQQNLNRRKPGCATMRQSLAYALGHGQK